jgi:hypothetical protein
LLSAIPPDSLIGVLDIAASGCLSNHAAKLVKAQHTLIEAFKDYSKEREHSFLILKKAKEG